MDGYRLLKSHVAVGVRWWPTTGFMTNPPEKFLPDSNLTRALSSSDRSLNRPSTKNPFL